MKVLLVLAGLVACTLASGSNQWLSWLANQGQANGDWQRWQSTNTNNRQWGSQTWQAGGGNGQHWQYNNGGRDMMGYRDNSMNMHQRPNSGMNLGGQGILGHLLMMFMQMMQMNMQRGGGDSSERMGDIGDAMEKEFNKELVEMVIMEMKIKEKSYEFKQYITGICYMLHAYEEYMKDSNETMPTVTENDLEDMMTEADKMNDGEVIAWLVDMMDKEPEKARVVAAKVGMKMCKAGMELEEAMEKAESKKKCMSDESSESSESKDESSEYRTRK